MAPHKACRMRRLWILLGSIAVAGCGEEPDSRPASWGYIHSAIIVPSCATIGCHSETSAQRGLNFEQEESTRSTLLQIGDVRPGDPNSKLILQLQGVAFEQRPRMPPDAPLPAADVELIRSWIQQGALP